MSKSAWVEVEVRIETDMAYMFYSAVAEGDVWIPKSMILDYSEAEFEIGDTIEIDIPEWIAIDKELV